MRIEMKVYETKMFQCQRTFEMKYKDQSVVPDDYRRLIECQRNVIQTHEKDERTNAICIPKG
jgi:hypothetical protein